MKYKIIFSENSKDDFFCIVKYIKGELLSKDIAEKYTIQILTAIKTLDEMPMRCCLCKHNN